MLEGPAYWKARAQDRLTVQQDEKAGTVRCLPFPNGVTRSQTAGVGSEREDLGSARPEQTTGPGATTMNQSLGLGGEVHTNQQHPQQPQQAPQPQQPQTTSEQAQQQPAAATPGQPLPPRDTEHARELQQLPLRHERVAESVQQRAPKLTMPKRVKCSDMKRMNILLRLGQRGLHE